MGDFPSESTRKAPSPGGSVANVPSRRLSILGTRGIPASHGGFETFAQRLALWLVDRGWQVDVYCQYEGGEALDSWRGVKLHQIPTKSRGPLGTMEFDLRSVVRSAGRDPLVLTLGYNTAIFNLLHRLRRTINVVNMDGLEWQRSKWGWGTRQWFRLNERLATMMSDHLIADHPKIAERLEGMAPKSRITMIPYGSDPVDNADPALLAPYGLEPKGYALAIARIEPENQTLEMVRAFSARERGKKLFVLGGLDPKRYPYHAEVKQAAGPEVIFPGPIYDQAIVEALRFHTLFYLHGHKVGGTNPSLVEALGAGSPVLAHGNHFNRWVAGPDQAYFDDYDELEQRVTELVGAPEDRIKAMSDASRRQHAEKFQWEPILQQYEDVLIRMMDKE